MKKRIVYGVSALAIVAIGVAIYFVMQMPKEYETVAATMQDVTEIVAADGEIISKHEITYYTNVAAPIEGLTVKVGDMVSAGDEICTYDTEDLETALARASLQQEITNTAQNALLEQDAKLQQKLANAKNKYEEACIYEEFFQGYIDQFEDQLYEVALEQEIYEKLLVDVERAQAMVSHEMQDPDMDPDDLEDLNDTLLQKTVALNDQKKKIAGYDTASVKECMADCQQELEHWKEEKAKEEAKKDADDNTLTTSGKANAQAVKESSAFEVTEALKELEKGNNAVVIDNQGVVTKVYATDGEHLADGAPVITVADTMNLAVRVDVSKYDMDKIQIGQSGEVTIGNHSYQAVVSRIDQVALEDDANKTKVFVEADILDPDEYVLIGLEADISITTKTVEAVCAIPNEAVYTLDEGTVVYQVKDNQLMHANVVTGCSDGTYTEILEGLQIGEHVIVSAVAMEDTGKRAAEK